MSSQMAAQSAMVPGIHSAAAAWLRACSKARTKQSMLSVAITTVASALSARSTSKSPR